MMAMLQLFIAPLVAAALTLWAAWLALAAESDADLPAGARRRVLRTSPAPARSSRNLHVAHLALLVLAGAAAGGAVAWWARSPAAGLVRLTLAVGLVWVLGDLLPAAARRGGARAHRTRPARGGRHPGAVPAAAPPGRLGRRPGAHAAADDGRRTTPAPPSATCCSASSRWPTRPWPR